MARKPLDQLTVKRIALIKPSALGDIVHSLPVLHALRYRFPDAYICWVVNRSFEPLIRNHPDLSATLAFDRGALRRGIGGVAQWLDLVRKLALADFDLAIDLQGLFRSGLMTATTFAPRRVGLSSAREGARLAYTDVVRCPAVTAGHAVDRYWHIARALGVGHLPKVFGLRPDPQAVVTMQARLAGLPRPWFVLAVGSRWLTKRWPPRFFAELIRPRLRLGGSAIYVGASDERGLADESAAFLAGLPTCNLCGQTDLPELTATLALAEVVLSNDSGPLHLAAALGRPVVAPYTCTRVALHGPYGQRGAVETQVACRGSYIRQCSRLDCMKELTPDRLIPALTEALQPWAYRCRSA